VKVTAWRKVAVEVTPRQVRAYWQGEPIGTISRAALAAKAREMLADPDDPVPGVPADPLGTGIGVIVCSATVSYRNVVVEPFEEPLAVGDFPWPAVST
jgi:hypothetical protein